MPMIKLLNWDHVLPLFVHSCFFASYCGENSFHYTAVQVCVCCIVSTHDLGLDTAKPPLLCSNAVDMTRRTMMVTCQHFYPDKLFSACLLASLLSKAGTRKAFNLETVCPSG